MALVEPERVTTRGLGSSDVADLATLFPATPRLGSYDNSEVLVIMKTMVNGTPNGNPDFPASNLDYDPGAQDGAPDLVTASPLDGSPLSSPYSPPLGSPGPGNLSLAGAIGAPAGVATGHNETNGSLVSPHKTSLLISGQCETANVPGASRNLKKGKSF